MNYNYIEKIDALLEIQSNGIKIFYKDFYEDIKDFYQDAKNYLLEYPQKKEEVSILIDTIEKGDRTNVFYLHEILGSSSPKYAYYFQEILLAKEK